MMYTIDLAVFLMILGYCAVIVVSALLEAFGHPPLRLVITNSVINLMILALIARYVFGGLSGNEIMWSLAIGVGTLLLTTILYAKVRLGGGVAKAFPITLAFLGPDYLVITLGSVFAIIFFGGLIAVAIKNARDGSAAR